MFAPLQRSVEVSPAPKRKGLEMIGSIFRKKTKEAGPSCDSMGLDGVPSCPGVYPSSSSFSPYNFPPNSPVSPRVRNLKEDMDILTMSRQDNPYISSKLEEISNAYCTPAIDHQDIMILRQGTASPYSPHLSLCYNRSSLGDASQSILWTDDDAMEAVEGTNKSGDIFEEAGNLHDHLIRSPPPQFPTNIASFVFPEPGSPLLSMASSTALNKVVRSPRVMKAVSQPSPEHARYLPEEDKGITLTKPQLIRRASAGGQTEFVSSRGSPLRCSKRASSGPNIVKSPNMSIDSSSGMSQSESREALLNL